jgi:hypothetical protein
VRQDDNVRFHHRQQLDTAVDVVHHHPVALVLALEEPATPRAVMRWKCSETPCGANAIISGSIVGFPGGSRNPNRPLQPIIFFAQVFSVVRK